MNSATSKISVITPAQCRGARALLDWSRDDLAKASKVAERTVIDFERGARSPREATMQGLIDTFETAGIVFVPSNGNGPGVRLRDPSRSE